MYFKHFIYITANLEEENKALKSEYCRLAKDADSIEEQEARLLKDLTGQLSKYYLTTVESQHDPSTKNYVNNVLSLNLTIITNVRPIKACTKFVTHLSCVAACANSSMGILEDELDRQKEENRAQHERILALESKLYDTEMKVAKVSNNNITS